MIAKLLSGAVVAGLLLAVSAPASYAGDAPKTKAACEKTKNMHWDDASGKCVKS